MASVCAASSAWWVTPGESAILTARAMGAHPFPAMIHPLWEMIVRAAAGLLPAAHTVAAIQGINVLCAAAAVGLAFGLGWEIAGLGGVGRERDRLRTKAGMAHETQAPRALCAVAGVWAAVLLGTHLPMLIAATRPLPNAFHAALHLAGLRLLVSALRHRRAGRYAAAVAVMGLTLTEDTSALPLIACAGLVMLVALFRQRLFVIPALSDRHAAGWRLGPPLASGLAFLGAWLLPLLINATLLSRHPAHVWLGYDGWWVAVRDMFVYSFGGFRTAWPDRGWLIVTSVTLAPALLVWFAALGSDERPAPRTLGLLLLPISLAVALAWNVRIAPWRLFGLSPLSIAGGVIIALWGAAAGALWTRAAWVQWQTVTRRFPSRTRTVPLKLRAAAGWGVPVAVWLALIGGAAREWSSVRGGEARVLREAAHAITRDAADRAWILSSGWMDDMLRIALFEQNRDASVLGLSQLRQPPMQRYLTDAFRSDPQVSGLMSFSPETALTEWLEVEGSTAAVIFDLPMLWLRSGGLPGPRIWVYERMEPGTDAAAHLDRVRAVAAHWDAGTAGLIQRLQAADGPFQPHAQRLLFLLSRTANDRGIVRLDTGDPAGAREEFTRAREAFPQNLVPQWNEAVLEEGDAAREAAFARIRGEIAGLSVMDRAALAQGGMIHGRLMQALGRNPAEPAEPTVLPPHRRFDLALQAGIQRKADELRAAYEERKLPPDEAVLGAAQVISMFEERKMEPGREALGRLRRAHRDDPVLLFTDIMLKALQGGEEALRLAESVERQMELPPPVELAVVKLAMNLDREPEAVRRLDLLSRRAPGFIPGLELRLQLALRRGDSSQVREAATALITADRNHPFALHIMGSLLAQSHRYPESEALLRRAAGRQASASLLNDLSWVMARNGRAAEAEPLIRKVMDSAEANAMYADTLVEVYLALDRSEAARAALEDALDRWPDAEVLLRRKRDWNAGRTDGIPHNTLPGLPGAVE